MHQAACVQSQLPISASKRFQESDDARTKVEEALKAQIKFLEAELLAAKAKESTHMNQVQIPLDLFGAVLI